ncbi:hypothetical protein BD408DRAFT_423850 [Parasitella parasitica]|nr:hypothetical protein BD408DRAFT_423850 [Parasitella parasitica]
MCLSKRLNISVCCRKGDVVGRSCFAKGHFTYEIIVIQTIQRIFRNSFILTTPTFSIEFYFYDIFIKAFTTILFGLFSCFHFGFFKGLLVKFCEV